MYSLGATNSRHRLLAADDQPEITFPGYRRPSHDWASATPPQTPPKKCIRLTPPSTRRSRRGNRIEKSPSHSRSVSELSRYGSSFPPSAVSTIENISKWPNYVRQAVRTTPANFHHNGVPPQHLHHRLEAISLRGRHSLGSPPDVMEYQTHLVSSQMDSQPRIESIHPSKENIHDVDPEYSMLDTDIQANPFINSREQEWVNSSLLTPSFGTTSSHDATMAVAKIGLDNFDHTGTGQHHYNHAGGRDFSDINDVGLGINFSGNTPNHNLLAPQYTTVRPSDTQIKRDPSPFLPTMPFDTLNDFDSPPQSLYSTRYNSYSPSPAAHLSTGLKQQSTSPESSPTASKRQSSSKHNRSRSRSASAASFAFDSTSNQTQHNPSPTQRRKSRPQRACSKSAFATPKKNSKGEISFDFVNLTPNDHKVILTAVAPSGSSKTKARRDKEAEERKLFEF